MNFFTLYINFVAFMLLYASKYPCSGDVFVENDRMNSESELQSHDLDSKTTESSKFFQDPNLYNNDSTDPQDQSSDPNLIDFKSFQPPSDVKFFTFDPNDGTKFVEIASEKYTVRQNSNNIYKFQYEFADDAHCVKVKCDNSTIWKSGDFKIPEAKYITYNTKTDRIMIRDDERYVTYRLVDDDLDQQTESEPSVKDKPTDLSVPFNSSVTYVTYSTDPVKVYRQRTQSSGALILLSLFGLLVLMTLMLIGLLLLVVRLYKVVDQIKFDIGSTDTKVVF